MLWIASKDFHLYKLSLSSAEAKCIISTFPMQKFLVWWTTTSWARDLASDTIIFLVSIVLSLMSIFNIYIIYHFPLLDFLVCSHLQSTWPGNFLNCCIQELSAALVSYHCCSKWLQRQCLKISKKNCYSLSIQNSNISLVSRHPNALSGQNSFYGLEGDVSLLLRVVTAGTAPCLRIQPPFALSVGNRVLMMPSSWFFLHGLHLSLFKTLVMNPGKSPLSRCII